ncbi:hypothetical protein KP509_39G011500 [Ceratopteris richardii]|nr:hypothetical protein KP509_39G011500 [Ceratopteris richardii]
MYGRCGAKDDAFSTFFHFKDADHFSWNLLLGACCQNAWNAEAFHSFLQMQVEGFIPNKHAFLSLLPVYGSVDSVWTCKAIHTHVINSGSLPDIVLESALVNMYGKRKSVNDSRKIFDNMAQKNVFSWNSMISAYAEAGQSTDALLLFQEMLLNEVAPSSVTFVSLFDVCTNLASPELTKVLHSYATREGFDSDVVVATSLINVYGKCGDLRDAILLFNKLPGKAAPSWNVMIQLSATHGHSQELFHLLKEMATIGVVPNSSTFISIISACAKQENLLLGKIIHFLIESNGIGYDIVMNTALISMYSKCGSLFDAQAIYCNISECDSIAWAAMVSAYIQNGQRKEAVLLIQDIPPGTLLSRNAVINMLDACAEEGSLEGGRTMHILVLNSDFSSDLSVGTAIINMYSKCGDLEDASYSFKHLNQHDLVSWNAIISACAQHGQYGAVVDLLCAMCKQCVLPDGITFTCILTALSHVGIVDDADLCFLSMESYFGVPHTVDHCNCLLDLFGRCGLVEEAGRLILSMPFQPTIASWMTFLSANRVYPSLFRGDFAARHAYEIEPDFGAPYIVLGNLCKVVSKSENADAFIGFLELPPSLDFSENNMEMDISVS